METSIRLASASEPRRDQRASPRRHTAVAGRLVWRDEHRTARFATVLIRNVSEHGVYVECVHGARIPQYRLVMLQAERHAHGHSVVGYDELPEALQRGRVLCAVFRVGPSRPSTGAPEGYGLRMLVDPRGQTTARRRVPAGNAPVATEVTA